MNRNPYDFTAPVRDPAMFFGRQDLLHEMVASFRAPGPHSYCLFGGRRFGKTSLLRAIERELIACLAAGKEPCTAPVYIDLNFELIQSRGGFFARALQLLRSVLRHHLPHLALDDEYLDQLETQIGSGPEPLVHFEKAFVYLRNTAFPALGTLQAVLLVDESELILRQPWAPELHSNLRALLSNRPLVQEHLGIQMAGSSNFYAKITEEGSPLRNILLKRLLPPLSEQESHALICQPTQDRLPPDVVTEVMRQADGHPFLLQYIMHYLWAAGIERATVEMVHTIVEQFANERDDFEDWCDAIGATGERIYALIGERNDWVKRSEIFAQMNEKPGDLKKALETLLYHGLVHQDSRYGYRRAGAMFWNWFAEIRVPYVRRTDTSTPDLEVEAQHLHALLRSHRANLRVLEEQMAQFGLRVPLDLINERNREVAEIERLEERLAQLLQP